MAKLGVGYFYCLPCRQHRTGLDVRQIRAKKNNNPAAIAICEVCGGRMMRWMGNKRNDLTIS